MAHSELGINGVKIVFAECETGYATDRGLDCYERLKRNGPTGAAFVVPRSTGVTFLLTDRAYTDKIPLLTPGYGRAASKDGSVFMWNSAAGDLLVGRGYCDPTCQQRDRRPRKN
jgi:branched-chain amino acid transport system substrate-binding protein